MTIRASAAPLSVASLSVAFLAVAVLCSACTHAGGLTPGRLVPGALAQTDQEFADGSHYRVFPFQGHAGDTITAQLTSDDFEANLILTDTHRNHLAEDDDGGGDRNASPTELASTAGNC